MIVIGFLLEDDKNVKCLSARPWYIEEALQMISNDKRDKSVILSLSTLKESW